MYKFKTALLVISFLLTVLTIKSQDLEKKISITEKDIGLEEVIEKLSVITGIKFSYNPEQIKSEKKISVSIINKKLSEVLKNIFNEFNIEFYFLEKQVILKPLKLKAQIKNSVENTFTISGYLKDSVSGEHLIGAAVQSVNNGKGTHTNSYGFFSITLPEGENTVKCTYIGYKPVIYKVNLSSNQRTDFSMSQKNELISEVEVIKDVTKFEQESDLGEVKFSTKALSQTPGFAGNSDIIKSLHSIPGINTFGDGSSMFFVRGGNFDQNLILLDEAPIYNPSHLFGFFTVITPDAIKDVEAYKGNFPANYGGRLSSVIDIKTKDGNMNSTHIGGCINPFASSVTIEGPIKKQKSSFFLSGRKSNMEWLKLSNRTDESMVLNFFDINAKFNLIPNEKNRFFLSLYGGYDNFSRIGASEINTYGFNWYNLLGTIRWNHIYNMKLFSNTTLYSSLYNYDLYISKDQADYWNSSIASASLKTDYTWYINPNNTIKTGAEIKAFKSNPGNITITNKDNAFYAPEISKYRSLEYNYYLSNTQKIGEKFSITYGVRIPVWQNFGSVKYYSFNTLVDYAVIDTTVIPQGEIYSTFISPEPKIEIKYIINSSMAVKAGYFRTSQFLQVLSNSVSPFTTLDVWVPAGPSIFPQKADMGLMELYKSFSKTGLVFSTSIYYKEFYNQLSYTDHANMLFNPYIEGEVRMGGARSFGAELLLKKESGKLNGWMGYSYSRVYKFAEGVNFNKPYPANQDRPHCFSINIAYRHNHRWNFSANWIYLTGAAITTPVSFFNYGSYTIPIYEERNNDRLPDYHRMDFTATYQLSKENSRYQHSLSLNIFNLYDRKNAVSVNFNKIRDDNGNIIVPTALPDNSKKITLLNSSLAVVGIVPAISYNFRF